jgi:molecular chaperone GrpE
MNAGDDTKNTQQQEDALTEKSTTPQQEPDYKNLFLRTNADLQNFKRRVEKERAEWSVLIQADVLERILPIVDEFETAVQIAEQKAPEGSQIWLEGFQLILKNLKKQLAELGVEEIDTTGIFNPEFHEALMQVESTDRPSGQIVQQFSRGYSFKGKVIKHARVSVAK